MIAHLPAADGVNIRILNPNVQQSVAFSSKISIFAAISQ
jgi:hypothetical protein